LWVQIDISILDVIEDVVSRIKSIRGVRQVLILTEEDKRRVLELEREAEQRVMMGLGLGDNRGVKVALRCDVVVAFITDAEYEWPPGPNLVLTWKGKVIGEDVVMGNFVVYKDRVPMPSLIAEEPPLAVFPPKPCPEIENVPRIYNAVQGSPSPPADTYLKKRMNTDLRDPRLGTALVGFNLE